MGDEVRKLHDSYFRSGLRTISPLDGAPELVEALAGRGHRVVLASSSEADLVDALLDIVDVGHHLHAVVTGSDDVASKPSPDLVRLAVERAGGGRAVVVGDASGTSSRRQPPACRRSACAAAASAPSGCGRPGRWPSTTARATCSTTSTRARCERTDRRDHSPAGYAESLSSRARWVACRARTWVVPAVFSGVSSRSW